MYVGGNTVDTIRAFVAEGDGIVFREVRHTAVLQALFNEVLSNAVDNHCRGAGTTCIKVKLTPEQLLTGDDSSIKQRMRPRQSEPLLWLGNKQRRHD